MSKRREGIAISLVVAPVAAMILLVGLFLPGTSAAGASSLARSSSSSVLQVELNGVLVKQYSLDQLEALTPFAGYAGYLHGAGAVAGPDAVTGTPVSDIVADSVGGPLADAESVEVAEVPLSSGYEQTFTASQLLDPLDGFTLYDATTLNTITPSTLTGTLAALLIYSDPAQNVMPSDAGPLRFVIADSKAENAVMTGKYSVSQVNQLNVIDSVSISLKAKPASALVGKAITFSGTVTNAIANDSSVKLRQVTANGLVLAKGGSISGSGAFKLTYKAAKAGTLTFVATYKAGKTFLSNQVSVKVKK